MPRAASRVPRPVAAELGFDGARLQVSVEAGTAMAKGDAVAAFIGDDLVATAALRLRPRATRLTATLDLADLPPPVYPALLRLQNQRSGTELRPPTRFAIRFDTADELIAALGPPALNLAILSVTSAALSVRITADRLPRHPRRWELLVDGAAVAAATGPAGDVAFAGVALRAGQSIAVRGSGAESPPAVLAAADLLDAALATVAALATRLDAAEAQQARLQARLDTAIGLSRDRLLLDRLDLFYLLLNERIDREMRAVGNPPLPPPASAPPVLGFRASEVEGVGMFDLETNGRNEWRWFSPDVTLIFRDVGAPVSRVVLQFHNFGEVAEGQAVQVSMAGTRIAGELRQLTDGSYLLEIPVRRADAWPDGSVIVHLSFARHYTTAADPRLLSAVFSGAELFTLGGA